MKIGYPCINHSLNCTANSTFRLANYSQTRLIDTVTKNLACLQKILEFNIQHNLLFFRISSDLIPFAAHEICDFDWPAYFKPQFQALGKLIKQANMRISMHPDQFVLINALKPEIIVRSISELEYHATILDLLELDHTAKIQIHVGGAYGDKLSAMQRFITNYHKLSAKIKARLVIEHDDRLFSLQDCLAIHAQTKIPILFDFLHHTCLNNQETIREAVILASNTWQATDGILMTDYSSQAPRARLGKHSETLDPLDFAKILTATQGLDFDIMLEIKDKERSAIKALKILNSNKLIAQ